MALTTLPHSTHRCALNGRKIYACLGSPENTPQPRSDISVLEPNISSGASIAFFVQEPTPPLGASLLNTTMNLIHMLDSFLQDAIYITIFKTMAASYAHVYLKKIKNNKSLISKPNT